jgi:glucosamine--fructose-6-phosphate aminotransferase (isomerizing)
MMIGHSRFIEEIFEQPQALKRCVEGYPDAPALFADLRESLHSGKYRQIILTGMGSSLHACYPLWLSLNANGRTPALLWDASILLHHASTTVDDRTLLIAVSQSGETVEMRRLLERIHRPGLGVAVTNGPENTLAQWADVMIDTRAGDEKTVSTKSYATTLAALYLLEQQLLGSDMDDARISVLNASETVGRHLEKWQSLTTQIGDTWGRCEYLAFMGRGVSMASALTGALITMEASKIFCVGMSSGQFRHGPLELVQEGFHSVVFAGLPSTRGLNQQLAEEIADHGGECLYITPEPDIAVHKKLLGLPLPDAAPGLLPIFEIIPIQFLTILLAKSRGVTPAAFRYATKVTHRE